MYKMTLDHINHANYEHTKHPLIKTLRYIDGHNKKRFIDNVSVHISLEKDTGYTGYTKTSHL